MKKIIAGILVISLLLIVGCDKINLSQLSDEDLERISEKAVVCNKPYIRVGLGCCLDKDDDKICDNDERIDPSSIPDKPIIIDPSSIPNRCSIDLGLSCTDFLAGIVQGDGSGKINIILTVENEAKKPLSANMNYKESKATCSITPKNDFIETGKTFEIECRFSERDEFPELETKAEFNFEINYYLDRNPEIQTATGKLTSTIIPIIMESADSVLLSESIISQCDESDLSYEKCFSQFNVDVDRSNEELVPTEYKRTTCYDLRYTVPECLASYFGLLREEPILVEKPICYDSDGGKNYYVKGYVTYEGYERDGELIKEYDKCAKDVGTGEDVVQEKYCPPEGGIGSTDYKCPNGCEDGACNTDNIFVSVGEEFTLIEDQTVIVKDYHGEGSSNYEDLGYRFNYTITYLDFDNDLFYFNVSERGYREDLGMWSFGESVVDISMGESSKTGTPLILSVLDYDLSSGEVSLKLSLFAETTAIIPDKTGCVISPAYNEDQCDGFRCITSLDASSACYSLEQCLENRGGGTCVKSPAYSGDLCDGYRVMPGISRACYSYKQCVESCVEVEEKPVCTDSDGGKDYYVKGTTVKGDFEDEERCYLFETTGSGVPVTECSNTDTRCKLHEYWCEGDDIVSEEYACPNGCKDGACISD